jgi:hypothetical protein
VSVPALALLLACVTPTDDSDSLVVTVVSPATTLIRGTILRVRAEAWHRISEGSGAEKATASFVFSSDSQSVATVENQPDGSAIVTGVNTGRTVIRATPVDYQDAQPGLLPLRVTNTVEIDSVVPDTVRYGDQLVVYGVGLDRIARVSLGEVNLIPDSAGFSANPGGEGQGRFWVPYPASTGRVLAVAAEGFSAPAARSTVVVPASTFATPDGSAALVDLDGPAGQPGAPLFANPALVFLQQDSIGPYFRFTRTDTTRAVSIVISTSEPVVQSLQPFVAPAVGKAAFVASDLSPWSIGLDRQYCKRALLFTAPGVDFGSRPATLVRAFAGMPRAALEMVVQGGSPGRFAIEVVDGYLTGDPRIAPDRLEENDFCEGADDPAKRLILTEPRAERLTIDNPYEVDWIRFTVPGEPDVPQLLTIRSAARPLAATDASDLALHVAPIDSFSGEETVSDWIAQADVPGSEEILTFELVPGDYYLAVTDVAGVVTPYSLCLALGSTCVLPE